MTDQKEIRWNTLTLLESSKPLPLSYQKIREHHQYVDRETREYEVRQALTYLANKQLITRHPDDGLNPERFSITTDGLAALHTGPA